MELFSIHLAASWFRFAVYVRSRAITLLLIALHHHVSNVASFVRVEYGMCVYVCFRQKQVIIALCHIGFVLYSFGDVYSTI